VAPEVVTRFAAASGWPVLADPLSGLRAGANAIAAYEALLRSDRFARAHRPELVVRLGAPLTSKIANAWLDGVPAVLCDPDDAWLDPPRSGVEEHVRADAGALLTAIADTARNDASRDGVWGAQWRAADAHARIALDAILDEDVACEARVARDVAAAVPGGGALLVASSLPVRALEWAMAPRESVRVVANRGANGIDGFVSAAFGFAGAHDGPVVALTGDLCFLHDTNGLLNGRGERRPAVTFVVVDNGGGAIFSYLAQNELPAPEFERIFATSQDVDLVSVARAHGVEGEHVDANGLQSALAAGGDHARVLVVPVDRDAARKQHARMWDAVSTSTG
jgi:2-succinyl-5-enolpyruvyl-6-hydroxy-3-cyclohexene-1-carboxylate synthase